MNPQQPQHTPMIGSITQGRGGRTRVWTSDGGMAAIGSITQDSGGTVAIHSDHGGGAVTTIVHDAGGTTMMRAATDNIDTIHTAGEGTTITYTVRPVPLGPSKTQATIAPWSRSSTASAPSRVSTPTRASSSRRRASRSSRLLTPPPDPHCRFSGRFSSPNHNFTCFFATKENNRCNRARRRFFLSWRRACTPPVIRRWRLPPPARPADSIARSSAITALEPTFPFCPCAIPERRPRGG